MAERDDKGKFVKGHAKQGGRKEGTPNAVQKELRALLQNFSVERYETFVRMALECEPKDFCKIYLEALKFNLPALQSISLDATDEVKETIESKLRQLSQNELEQD